MDAHQVPRRGSRRRARVSIGMLLTVAAAVMPGCAAGPKAIDSFTPIPTATATPLPTADIFAGLPYRIDLPTGWILASAQKLEEVIQTLERTNPEVAAEWGSKPLGEDQILAFQPALDLHLSVVTSPVIREGATDAEVLDYFEEANLEALRKTPDLVQQPTADRVELPIGEARRIRWSQTLTTPQGGRVELFTVGYLFAGEDTIFTIVISTKERDRAAEIEAIIETFRLQ